MISLIFKLTFFSLTSNVFVLTLFLYFFNLDCTDINTTPRRKLDFGFHEDEENSEKDLDRNANREKSVVERHSIISREKIPAIDMEFDTEEIAFDFYREYAKMTGFSIRRHHMHKDVSGKIIDRTFCCSCQGHRKDDKRDAGIKKHRPETRTNCSALMTINCRYTGIYKITKFVAEHQGHDLVSPAKTHMLRSHRRLTTLQASQADNIERAGIAPTAGFAFMTNEGGGREEVGFIFEDYKNYLRSKRSIEMKVSDTGGIFEYLQQKQLNDPSFFYAVQVDEDASITNILWVDGRMKFDYVHFGDVICFDTTHKKNKEGRPFALFVGVNHHKQTVIFGAALLYDETASTFVWLFDTFAKAMRGKLPITILTDQDAAMAKALASQWPETYHRLCIWHIYQNAATHLGSVFESFPSFLKDFSSCVYDYDEEVEFLDAWSKMLEKYELQENGWLIRLFKIKEKWALVYGRQSFCADMTTTQRSESMHASLKRYVSYKHDLLRFFQHFDRLVEDRRYKELKADLRTKHTIPVNSIPVQILKHAASVYTHEVFELFKKEFSKACDSKIDLCSKIGETFEYMVTPFGKHYQHKVRYDSFQENISCSCKKFEFAGILCSHALKVLSFSNILRIPELYIKRRWTKEANKNLVDVKLTEVDIRSSRSIDENEERQMNGIWSRELCGITNQLVTRASLTRDRFRIAKDGLLKLLGEVEVSSGQCVDTSQSQEKTHSNSRLYEQQSKGASNGVEKELDGERCISKGVAVTGWKKKENKQVTSGKRIKSGLEKSVRGKKKKQNKVSSRKHASLPTQDINKVYF